MKYKVLLTGNNKRTINEFFTYMDLELECMSTSERYDDIINHLKCVEPDAFVYCLNGERPDDLKRFANVESKITDRNIPVVVVGDPRECDQFVKVVASGKANVIHKPRSVQALEDMVIQIMDRAKLMRSKEEKKNKSKAAPAQEEELNLDDAMKAAEALLAQLNAEEVKENKEEKKEEEFKRKHILIVDDDSSILKLLKGYLAERYDVATAISGKVALKFLETRSTDLVLLDYEMPGENGPAVLSKIRADKKTKNLPVVFLTGVTEREKIQEVLSKKPQGYLLKPVDMGALSSTIKGILDRKER